MSIKALIKAHSNHLVEPGSNHGKLSLPRLTPVSMSQDFSHTLGGPINQPPNIAPDSHCSLEFYFTFYQPYSLAKMIVFQQQTRLLVTSLAMSIIHKSLSSHSQHLFTFPTHFHLHAGNV